MSETVFNLIKSLLTKYEYDLKPTRMNKLKAEKLLVENNKLIKKK